MRALSAISRRSISLTRKGPGGSVGTAKSQLPGTVGLWRFSPGSRTLLLDHLDQLEWPAFRVLCETHNDAQLLHFRGLPDGLVAACLQLGEQVPDVGRDEDKISIG